MNLFQWIKSLFHKKPSQTQPVPVPTPTPAPSPTETITPPPSSPPVPTGDATLGPPQPRVDPAPYGRNNYGTPFQSQAEADAWKQAVAAQDAQKAELARLLKTEYYNGPVDVKSLTKDEKAFLTYVTSNYGLGAQVWFAILKGSLGEINQAINEGDPLVKEGGYNVDSYQGRMRGYVDDYAKGRLKVDVTHA